MKLLPFINRTLLLVTAIPLLTVGYAVNANDSSQVAEREGRGGGHAGNLGGGRGGHMDGGRSNIGSGQRHEFNRGGQFNRGDQYRRHYENDRFNTYYYNPGGVYIQDYPVYVPYSSQYQVDQYPYNQQYQSTYPYYDDDDQY